MAKIRLMVEGYRVRAAAAAARVWAEARRRCARCAAPWRSGSQAGDPGRAARLPGCKSICVFEVWGLGLGGLHRHDAELENLVQSYIRIRILAPWRSGSEAEELGGAARLPGCRSIWIG